MKPKEKAIRYLQKYSNFYMDSLRGRQISVEHSIDIALKARDREWEKLIELARKNSFSNGFNKGVISGSKAYKERVKKVIDEFILLHKSLKTMKKEPNESIIMCLEKLKQKLEGVKWS